ncbi:MAG: uroporphyrinogen decarboxylase [bacterium]
MESTTTVFPFLAALRGERPATRPVWIMRQAGRILPEYHELRKRYSFSDLCQTPELACQVTLQPIQRFGFDAAILFNDILLPLNPLLAPLGDGFVFTDRGPQLARPVRQEQDVAAFAPPAAARDLAHVAEAIRMLKGELNGTPLIGFAGAPWTLAAYLVEGGGSRNHQHLKSMLFNQPELLQVLLDKLTDQVIDYLRLQIAAGVDAIQLFDSWAGILTPEDYEAFVLPTHRRIFAALQTAGVPRILFVKGSAPFLDQLTLAGADAVSLDWTLDLTSVIPRLGDLKLQGNLDPSALFGPPAEIRRRVTAICRAGDLASGHVFSLGHGVLPDTPLAGVEALVQAVRDYRPQVS